MIPIQPGQLITAKFLQDFAAAIRRDVLEYGIGKGAGIEIERHGADRISIRAKKQAAKASATIFRLQILDASSEGEDKIRVRLGKCGGYLADATMDDPDDATHFVHTLTGTGVRVIVAQMPMNYSGNGNWNVAADGTIIDAVALPASDDEYFYVELGSVDAPGDGSGVTVFRPQPVSGDVKISRIGNSTAYFDSQTCVVP